MGPNGAGSTRLQSFPTHTYLVHNSDASFFDNRWVRVSKLQQREEFAFWTNSIQSLRCLSCLVQNPLVVFTFDSDRGFHTVPYCSTGPSALLQSTGETRVHLTDTSSHTATGGPSGKSRKRKVMCTLP